MWKGAQCFVSGGAAQIGDRLQFLQLKTGRWGLWLPGRAVQSHSRAANPSIAAEMGLQYKDNCQHFTAVREYMGVSWNTRVCPGIHVYVYCGLLNIINSSLIIISSSRPSPTSTPRFKGKSKPFQRLLLLAIGMQNRNLQVSHRQRCRTSCSNCSRCW